MAKKEFEIPSLASGDRSVELFPRMTMSGTTDEVVMDRFRGIRAGMTHRAIGFFDAEEVLL